MRGWRAYAWVAVWLLGTVFARATAGSAGFALAFVVGAVVGAVWQVVARRDVAERLTWVAVMSLGSGIAFAVDSLVGSDAVELTAGAPVLYLAAVLSSVVVTERVLRRRELGPVTLDMVHAPEGAEGTGIRRPDGGR